ncbi:hypothetical protein Dsin_021632 [Dipteronia sinensis]|uniref:peroxidase n=1 Tax=Dipteronia sinensis TaxID=43782 RepID=A0AAE0A100_9ROSI|nr:hypothetical protein Dsin_021632 [Dipteronia sinensis]
MNQKEEEGSEFCGGGGVDLVDLVVDLGISWRIGGGGLEVVADWWWCGFEDGGGVDLVEVALGDLRAGFYNSNCPRAESIILGVVQRHFSTDKSITAALLRMHFHDCFVRGCDASILLDSTSGKQSEKEAGPNLTVRGFELIDEAKKALEKACPSTVSCADIITLATRDAVFLAGGLNYAVPTGRRDGLVSNMDEVNLPGPTLTVPEALQSFTSKGLNVNDMTTLLGGHTVGVAHCSFFQDRLSNFQGTGAPDSSMDPTLVAKLKRICGINANDPTAFLDQNTSFAFDNEFYNQIRLRRGVLQIDQELASDTSTAGIVSGFASNPGGFQRSFANAMIKMGNIQVLVGNAGEIRQNCRGYCHFLCVYSSVFQVALADLRIGFYKDTCPGAESIIFSVVQSTFARDKSITPALVRMYFHDCFNAACDASILIDSTSAKPSEKAAVPNLTVRGFELIDKVKKALEEACPSTVSCTDIIAVATRDAVALAGGLNYTVPTGRLDGLQSDPSKVNLPATSISVVDALQMFEANRLDTIDMVALLGGHTVGVAHCSFFKDRLSSPDGSMDPSLFQQLWTKCLYNNTNNVDPPANLDQQTPFDFDNQYYKQIKMRRGILQIDQRIASDELTFEIVKAFALNPVKFQQSFANAMIKLGNLAANVGEIRQNCRVFNQPQPQPQQQNNQVDKQKLPSLIF